MTPHKRQVPGTHTEPHTPHSFLTRYKRTRKARESRTARRERLARLEHASIPKLFQTCPYFKKPSFWRPRGYTHSLEAFFRSARQRRATIIRNNRMMRYRFTHFAVINLYEARHPALINRDFGELVKRLRTNGLVGHWTIEVDRKNIVHWHLLVVNFDGNERTLKKLVSRCLDEVKTFPRRRVHAEAIRNPRQKLGYVLKIPKSGRCTDAGTAEDKNSSAGQGKCLDIYATDRVLFETNTGLDKHGTFGDFWAKGWNEKRWWNLIRNENAAVAANFENPRIRRLVYDIHERLGICLERVKWAYCLTPPWHLMEDQPVGPGERRNNIALRSSGLVRSLFARQHLPGASVGSCAPRGSSLVDQPRQAFVASPCSSSEFPVRVPDDLCLGSLSSVILNWLRVMCGLWRSSHKEPPYRGHAP